MDITFDALEYAKEMEQAGIERKAAVAQAQILQKAFIRQDELNRKDLATKADIELLRSELRGELRETESRLETQIADVKHEILKWVMTAILAQTALIVALIGVVIAYLPK